MFLFLTLACSSDDDSPAPDPRTDFVGTFELEDFDIRLLIKNSGTVTLDSIVSVTSNPEIEFRMDEGLDEDELKADFSELTESLWLRFFEISNSMVSATINESENCIAEISDKKFNLDAFYNEVVVSDGVNSKTYLFKFGSEGEMEKDGLSLDFNFLYKEENASLEVTGTVIGEKF